MTWLPTIVTVDPAAEPVTLAEVKQQCEIDHDDRDDLLDSYITAARQHVEKYCASPLVTQTVVLRAGSFRDLGRLPVGPIQSVTSVTYLDGTGAEQTLSTDVYEAVLIGLEPSIRLKVNQSWPSALSVIDAVRVTAIAGYGAAGVIPVPIKQAIMLTVAAWFASREVGALPDGAAALLTNYRA
jgi:uncharacterized phiE125 gp8 family phage protein